MEEISLEKIDIIRQRSGLTYAEAKQVLEANNGNVVDALIYIEQNKKTFKQTFTDNITSTGNEIVETVKEIINKGNVSRIKIKKDNRLLVDIPVTAGVAAGTISAILSPALVAVGTVAAIASKITIEIERPDGKVDVVNDIVKGAYNNVMDKVDEVKDKTTCTVNDLKNTINEKVQDFRNTDNVNNIKSNINDTVQNIKNSDTVNDLKNNVNNTFNDFKNTVNNTVDDLKNSTTANNIKNTINKTVNEFKGSSMVNETESSINKTTDENAEVITNQNTDINE